MRVRIIFELKNKGGIVPFHHQYLLSQLIRGVLRKGEEERYFEYPFFNFSGLKGQTSVSKNGLHYYSNKVTLVFSSKDKSFVHYFLKNLFALDHVEIGGLQLFPSTVEEELYPEMKEEMKYICISPLVLLEPKFYDEAGKKFINPHEDDFSDMLYESTMLRMQSSGDYDAAQLDGFNKFQVIPDEGYIEKLESSGKKYARIYPLYDQDINYEIRGYTFPFTLFAAPEVQEFIYTCGLGRYAQKGFGMLDVAHNEPGKRTQPFDMDAI